MELSAVKAICYKAVYHYRKGEKRMLTAIVVLFTLLGAIYLGQSKYSVAHVMTGKGQRKCVKINFDDHGIRRPVYWGIFLTIPPLGVAFATDFNVWWDKLANSGHTAVERIILIILISAIAAVASVIVHAAAWKIASKVKLANFYEQEYLSKKQRVGHENAVGVSEKGQVIEIED